MEIEIVLGGGMMAADPERRVTGTFFLLLIDPCYKLILNPILIDHKPLAVQILQIKLFRHHHGLLIVNIEQKIVPRLDDNLRMMLCLFLAPVAFRKERFSISMDKRVFDGFDDVELVSCAAGG